MKIRLITTSITGFSTNEGSLTVYFSSEDGSRKFKALAHPALKVSPHINVPQTLKIAETEDGWKMIQPYPSKEDIASWEEARAKRQASILEATEADLALLTF